MCDKAVAIVVENGTSSCKVGFAGDDEPKDVFPSIVGQPRHQEYAAKLCLKDHYVGHEALSKRGILSLRYPIERSIITNWPYMEHIWRNAFDVLQVDPKDHPILLTEPPLNPPANREKMAQIMFETFNSPALSINNHAVLSLYASGATNGVVFHSGAGMSHVVPISNGYALPQATLGLEFDGRDLTDHLMRLIIETGYSFTRGDARRFVQDMLETLCYVAQNFELEMVKAASSSTLKKKYEHPDFDEGPTISDERFRCPEAMFQPALMRMESAGIHTIIHDSIMKCDENIRKGMYGNILLAGGNTMYPGLAERLHKEMGILAQPGIEVKVKAPEQRKYSDWIGGSVFASVPSFQETCISKQEYEESGAAIVHKKCF